MKLNRYIAAFLALILLISLAGCGASTMKNSYAEEAVAGPMAPAMMADSAANDSLTSTSANGSAAIPENRKWIVTVYMSAETEDLDAMTAALDERIAALNGYVEDQRIYNGSAYATSRYRNAHLTVRIPAEQVDQFVTALVRLQKSMEQVSQLLRQEDNGKE